MSYIRTINPKYFIRVSGSTNLYRVRYETTFWGKGRNYGWRLHDYKLSKGDYVLVLGGRSGCWHIVVSSRNCDGLKLFTKCEPWKFG